MTAAKSGDRVRIAVAGRTASGTELAKPDESRQVSVGDGTMFPVLEQALVGMQVGQRREVHVAAADAFGMHRPDLVCLVERSNLPSDMELRIGSVLRGTHPSGRSLDFVVTKIEGAEVQLDSNHPLAGEDLVFNIQLLEIVSDETPT